MDYRRIEDHGVIGDMDTVALVDIGGTIDFMCFPFFDSPTIFASLLDHKKGGHFKISPLVADKIEKQMYLPDSNILLSRVLASCGISEISDFMVIEDKLHAHTLVRRAKSVRGSIKFRLECCPRFDYARCPHRARLKGKEVIFIPDDKTFNPMRLMSDIPLDIKENDAVCEFTLNEGESATFIFTSVDDSREIDPVQSFKNTLNFWHKWISQTTYNGRWREMVNRSALTLKLLTSRKYGSIVAAPTFGLPEELGGVRNWDYRYTWIRDASFTLYGLMRLGFTQSAGRFMQWVEKRCGDFDSGSPLQVMYGLDGRKQLTEETLSHFEGYCKSGPVRIGNAAFDQLQLDIYGELMDSIYMYDKYGERISFELWDNVTFIIDWVAKNWDLEDEGIWEVRGGKKKLLYSRVMCWVAIDRAIRLARKRSLAAPMQRWYEARDKIHRTILKDYWNDDLQSFVQSEHGNVLDASNLLMPLIRYISPTDPKWLSTLKAIGKTLNVDSLVFRYKIEGETTDGLSGVEGTFNMCSFWYIECLARSGDVKQARYLFEKMLSYANHLGLYAEELSLDGRHLGNFPQAFTHLALISAAFELDRSLKKQDIAW